MLIKLKPVVNYTSIFLAAYAQTFSHQKIKLQSQTVSREKMQTFVKKAVEYVEEIDTWEKYQ